jgi:peptide/nickel transport system permease protein
MKKYIFNRLIQAVVCLFFITIIVFGMTHLSGDPVMLMVPPEATPDEIEEMRVALGLRQPIYVQYWRFISRAVVGDFGKSLRWNTHCIDLFLDRFPATLLLGTTAMVFSVVLGIPIGIISAVKNGRWFDTMGKSFALMGQALPSFWLGIMLMMFFAVRVKILPTSGMGTWQHLVLPTVTLGWVFTASLTRMTRSAMLDVLDAEYIKMARTVGVPASTVVWKQALKNAFIPILTIGALNFIILLNGTVIVELVFNWPGVGRLVVDSIFARDFPVVQMCVLIATSLFVFTNLFVDILYAYIDPRIRYSS